MGIDQLTDEEKNALGDIVEGTIGSIDCLVSEAEEVYGKWLTILRKLGRDKDADEWVESLKEDGYLK